ncbi:hypothetical protein E3N88_19905 [Mikania micrantha]|uniref:Uncharacterized protein n=1 Tax=Mikania micrantha TaxID=192012 RepID=A0A5N6NQV5_9ASTR|nr:hypothetical protein E3N88_19905 [Mikania micrantha]
MAAWAEQGASRRGQGLRRRGEQGCHYLSLSLFICSLLLPIFQFEIPIRYGQVKKYGHAVMNESEPQRSRDNQANPVENMEAKKKRTTQETTSLISRLCDEMKEPGREGGPQCMQDII